MAKQINVCVGGVIKKVSKVPACIGGVVKEMKKGVCGVGGVVKTFFESDFILYESGNNAVGYVAGTTAISVNDDSIHFDSIPYLYASEQIDLSDYNTLHVSMKLTTKKQTYLYVYLTEGDGTTDAPGQTATRTDAYNASLNTTFTLDLDISDVTTIYPNIQAQSLSGSSGSGTVGNIVGDIYKIWATED